MNQRLNIINTYRFLSGNKNKPLQVRIYNSLSLIIIFSVLSICCILGVLFSMLVDWFSLDFNLTWAKSSTIVVSSILCLLFLTESLYSYVFLKHIKRNLGKIENKNAQVINKELINIITNKMSVLSNKLLFILGVVIFIVAILVKFFDTDFVYLYIWNYFKIPLLFFYFLLFKQTIQNLIYIKRNNILFEISGIK